MRIGLRPCAGLSALLLLSLVSDVFATDILKTNGFSTCADNSEIKITKLNIQYNRATNKVDFDVAGTSAKQQEVDATLIVSAYGNEVYRNEFNPCDDKAKVDQLCPVPAGNFAAKGSQSIPSEYANKIPAIAFSVPDLDGQARMELKARGGGKTLACIQSSVQNGQTSQIPAISYVAAGIAGAALLVSGLSSLLAGGQGAATPSPTFGETIGWFQSIAMNGMLSVKYPPVYQGFSQNFGFSGLLISWDSMQISIDNFRANTGGNLTDNNVQYIKNATLVNEPSGGKMRRSIEDGILLFARDVQTSVNNTNNSSDSDNKPMHFVHGLEGYAEKLAIPESNIFMTALLIFAIVVAAITVGILLFKVILETWALCGTFPKNLTTFRKRYWWLVAKTITNLILILYGIWTLYCVYQFTNGDSWAAKVLAGVTLAIFTAILGFFTFRIWQLAQKFKKAEGDASALYDDKETWRKYSLFYENFKKNYWWIFVPVIIYMFAKGVVIAGANGHGLVQSGGQLAIEAILLILLLWSRPYTLKSGNWINIGIQVVRVLSVVCILVFVEELGIAESTQTVTGVALVVMQSVLTGLLAILIAVNSLVICCRANPHRKKRKEAEKLNRDLDNLTPLDARNSLLMDPQEYKPTEQDHRKSLGPNRSSRGFYDRVPSHDSTKHSYHGSESDMGLLNSAASMDRRASDQSVRAPRLPNIEPSPMSYPRGYAY